MTQHGVKEQKEMPEHENHAGEILGGFKVTGDLQVQYPGGAQWRCAARCTKCGHEVRATAARLRTLNCSRCTAREREISMLARIGETVNGREIIDVIRDRRGAPAYVVHCPACGRITRLTKSKLIRSCACQSKTQFRAGEHVDPSVHYTRGRKINSNSTSGCRGVSRVSKTGSWRAYITLDRRQISLGSYARYEDAVKARKKAERRYFDERLPEPEYEAHVPDGYIPLGEWAELHGRRPGAALYHVQRGRVSTVRIGIGEYIDERTPWPEKIRGGKQ